MKMIPFFSRKEILSHPKLAPFWKEPATHMDEPQALDRAIMLEFPKNNIFVRHLMKNELDAEFAGGRFVGGTMTKEQVVKEMEKCMFCNARIVYVVDRYGIGVRLKDFMTVLLSSEETNFIQVEDSFLKPLEATVKHMKANLRDARRKGLLPPEP